MVFGESYDLKKDYKVYQTEKVPEFVCIYNTDTKSKEIYRYKNNKLQDGSYRVIYSNRDSVYGTKIFPKSDKNGEENRQYRLVKYADGYIEYQEQIYVIGQDKGWRLLTKYKFNTNKLGWEKLNLLLIDLSIHYQRHMLLQESKAKLFYI